MTSENAAPAEIPLNDRALQAAVIEGSNIADEYLVRKIVGAYLGALPGAPAEMPGIEEIARALAIFFANNRQPCMSGDPRDRLSPLRRRDLDDAARAVLDLFAPILAEKESLRRELHSLAVALHRKHYWHVKQWKPFDDALGLATQIDNMTAGLVPEARALAAEAKCDALREALARAQSWHESEDKALSKSGRSDADYHWRRLQHREQLDAIRGALPEAEYEAAWGRMNARYEQETADV